MARVAEDQARVAEVMTSIACSYSACCPANLDRPTPENLAAAHCSQAVTAFADKGHHGWVAEHTAGMGHHGWAAEHSAAVLQVEAQETSL